MTHEVLQGEFLNNVLQNGRLPVDEALQVGLRLALALRSAHENGTVYGVLDPSRIYLDGEDIVIQSAAESNRYTAPEVLRGAGPDVRSDVFAFGAILYTMLTGRSAFADVAGESILQPIQAVWDGQHEIPSSRLPGLDSLLRECLDRDPQKRCQSMRQIRFELTLVSAAAKRFHAKGRSGPSVVECLVRDRIAPLEASCAANAAASDEAVRQLQEAVGESREQLSSTLKIIQAQLQSHSEMLGSSHDALGRTDEVLERLADMIASCDAALKELQRRATATQERLQAELRLTQRSLSTQAASIEALEAGARRTDDLLERVVESIDALNKLFVDGAVWANA